jgi:thiol:disulfide interchange protein DsbA
MNADNFMRTYYALETIGRRRGDAAQDLSRHPHRAQGISRAARTSPRSSAPTAATSAKFLAAFKSFSVNTSVARAKKLMADYKVESVPMLVVHGRWMTSPSQAGSQERALAVVDQLVQRVRSGK